MTVKDISEVKTSTAAVSVFKSCYNKQSTLSPGNVLCSIKMKDLKAICTKTQLQVGRAGNTQRPKSVAQWSVVDVQVPQGVNAYRWVEKYSEYN